MSKESLIPSWRMQKQRYNLRGYKGNDGLMHFGEPHPHNIKVNSETKLEVINTNPDDSKNLTTQLSSEVL